MPSRQHGTRAIAALCIAILILGGCGGDDDSGSGTSTTPPPTGGSNDPAVIDGQPATSVSAGQAYQFQPTASDPDGDSLTFSITGRPDWATFNASTGRLSGTPTESDVGTYSNIRISVSDGQVTTQLQAFSVTVLAAGAAPGSALLTWTPPTQRTDGSALTNLSSYRVYYGTASGDYSNTITIDAGLSSYVVDSLSAGRWYFAMSALDSTGLESALSAEVSKQIAF